jgi:hypothetical protein
MVEEYMLKIWGKIVKNSKTIQDLVVSSDIEGSYQDNLKECITELCNKFDIPKPYWLPSNLDEYNRRGKTIFNQHNFVEELDFDRFIIQELDKEK